MLIPGPQNYFPKVFTALILCLLAFSCNDDDEIDISGISFDGTTIEVVEGLTIDLNDHLTVTGGDADLAELSFTSADPAVVSVNGSVLTAEGVGTTTVTAVEANSGLSTSVAVNVISSVISVSGVTLDVEELGLKIGETSQLTATVAPDDASDKSLTWSVELPAGRTLNSTEAENIATVSNSGLVTAVSAGTVVVSVSTTDGGFEASVTVTVTNIAVTGVSLDMTSLSVLVGESDQLMATVAPENATNKAISWSLSVDEGDPATYATVDATTGVVTGVSECSACGLALVVTTNDGAFTAAADLFINRVAVTSITLDPSSFFTIEAGTQFDFNTTVLPVNATDPSITWSISNGVECDDTPPVSNFATISSEGQITAIDDNQCGLEVTAQSVSDNAISTTVEFNVVVPVATVRIDDGDGSIYSGYDENDTEFMEEDKVVGTGCSSEQTFQLYATVTPGNASDDSITWSIVSGGDAEVDSDGLVTFSWAGPDDVIEVRATANDGSGASYTVVVDVTITPC